jgi:S-adenosylmethionine:tRNA ribosyltransferase-isomerase
LFLRETSEGLWELLATTRGKPRIGEQVRLESNSESLVLTLVEKGEAGRWLLRPDSEEPSAVLLHRHGRVPLPPYIRKGIEEPGDRLRYQTLYAQVPGAVAAPTAGLHFTNEIFSRLAEVGIVHVDVTLHVGLGTFRPIEVERLEDHVLHAEWAELGPEAATILEQCRLRGGRIVAVGSTSTRVLESAFDRAAGSIRPFRGETSLYLRPGYNFGAVDALVTNFHLPRSSLLVLVSAFAGVELVRRAYVEAVTARYRFYSYGDAMLIL